MGRLLGGCAPARHRGGGDGGESGGGDDGASDVHRHDVREPNAQDGLGHWAYLGLRWPVFLVLQRLKLLRPLGVLSFGQP